MPLISCASGAFHLTVNDVSSTKPMEMSSGGPDGPTTVGNVWLVSI